jgi:mono/diheme cytochrome c family protein
MYPRTPFGLLAVLVMAGTGSLSAQTPSDAAATPTPEKPSVETATPPAADQAASPASNPALIARGDAVYHGPGNCYACHGSKAAGSVGPNLADSEWIHSKGTYEDIVAQINSGVTKEQSKSGIPMPPKGGSTISDDDVKAVAAYIYSLRQK